VTQDTYTTSTRNSIEDCAFLCAVPFTREEFIADVVARHAKEKRGDYAARFAPEPSEAERIWSQSYSRMADQFLQLTDNCAALGVKVYPRATLDDLAEASRHASVIVILAHWKGHRFVASDLRFADAQQLITFARCSASECLHDLSNSLRDFLDLHPHKNTLDYVADFLNEWMFVNQQTQGFAGSAAALVNAWEQVEARDLLDDLLAPHTVPGNCLELRDGFHSADEVAAAISAEWSGVVDLSVCHSDYLGSKIKARNADNRYVVLNKMQKYPERCIPEILAVFDCFSGRQLPYLYVKAEVFKQVSNLYEAKG
jgi:hypothetical protein